jgi:hypothetical protein
MGIDFGNSGDNRLEDPDMNKQSLRGQLVGENPEHDRTDLLVLNSRDPRHWQTTEHE